MRVLRIMLAGLIWLPFPLQAAESVIPFAADPEAPVEVEAQSLEVDRVSSRALFSGAVQVRQGRLSLRAERMILVYDPDAPGQPITKIEAEEQVRLNSAGGQEAQGSSAIYDVASRQLVLSGPVRLRAQTQVLAGARLVVDLQKGESRLISGAQ